MRMRFDVLGPFLVEDDDEPVRLGGRLQQTVLAFLLASPGKTASVDAIVLEVWPDQLAEDVRDSLYVYVSQLRKAIGGDRIVRSDGGYRFEPGEDDVSEAASFEYQCRSARRLMDSDPSAAVDLFDDALARWRGRAYEGFEDIPSLALEAQRLEGLRLEALESHVEATLAIAEDPNIADLTRLCQDHPYRERLWGLLARSLYRAGRQAEAIRALSRLRSALGDELGIEPAPETNRLEEQILLHDPALEAAASPPATNLPTPVSSFTGRADESSLLAEMLLANRLVTVLGPGGTGKTRLAIEVGRRVLERFRDGVWFVDLAQVSEAEQVVGAVSAALEIAEGPGIDRLAPIIAHLRPRNALLVLDNCEHLVDSASEVATTLLESAPRLHILATSRVTLGGSGEVHFTLEGLDTSAADESLSEAEELFVARAASVRRDFRVHDGNKEAVSSVCRHLDGMPLAIELAAARTNTLSPDAIDRNLSDRFALLAQEPSSRTIHRSLHASMDWSYELLPGSAQQTFDALGVFEGPFSVAAASAVSGIDSEVETLNELQTLVEASLLHVIHESGGDPRYRLLETSRVYAREHLVSSEKLGDVTAAHDAFYAGAAAGLRAAFFGKGRVEARRQVEAELADYQTAFDRLLDHGSPDVMTMGWTMGHVWLFGGHVTRGWDSLVSLLDSPVRDRSTASADTLTAAAFLAMYDSRYDESIEFADAAIEIYRESGDRQGLSYALARGGHAAFSKGDGVTGMTMLQESIDLCHEIGYDDGLAWPITLLAQARRWSGEVGDAIREDLEEGRRRFIGIGEAYGQGHADMLLASMYEEGVDYRLRFAMEMVELSEQRGSDRAIRSPALCLLAYAVWDAGDRDRAEGLNRAALRSALETGASVNIGLDLLQTATFAGHQGRSERCARLFGAGDRYFTMARAPFMHRVFGEATAAATEALGSERFKALYDEGSALTAEEAVAYALSA